ncbi:uncharacterized protein EI90DRAFT_3045454 [Cantharellus anzutake]|uniref:uncharacterized protein n=1 Tax=Cantharellus anzutake TaxID=1750568 RepID=UPI001908C2A3|nr:uncharacterized protein EI90DRAFT_3045454 [Cantharellus anzutake]KAF8336352.1 hypothetical protein EI90DRAFT_3045454 [Cantharellus anzutake]
MNPQLHSGKRASHVRHGFISSRRCYANYPRQTCTRSAWEVPWFATHCQHGSYIVDACSKLYQLSSPLITRSVLSGPNPTSVHVNYPGPWSLPVGVLLSLMLEQL